MKKNSGQVLVLFVILLPILLLLLVIGIEVGNIYLDKTKTKNTIKEIITSNLKNYDDKTNERINKLIDSNIKNIEKKEIFTSEDEIRINIKQNKVLFGKNISINYKYIGKKEEETITLSEG